MASFQGDKLVSTMSAKNKSCLKAQNREGNCRELAQDIAIYEIIVESLI
jgi:hypothetical protein